MTLISLTIWTKMCSYFIEKIKACLSGNFHKEKGPLEKERESPLREMMIIKGELCLDNSNN